jgi:hypothetical protein
MPRPFARREEPFTSISPPITRPAIPSIKYKIFSIKEESGI